METEYNLHHEAKRYEKISPEEYYSAKTRLPRDVFNSNYSLGSEKCSFYRKVSSDEVIADDYDGLVMLTLLQLQKKSTKSLSWIKATIITNVVISLMCIIGLLMILNR